MKTENVPNIIEAEKLTRLGHQLMTGKPEEGVVCYKRAATLGSKDGQYHLAKCYEAGIGISKNPEMAHHWMAIAAHSGHADACMWMARDYERADDTEASLQGALTWYRKAYGFRIDSAKDEAERVSKKIRQLKLQEKRLLRNWEGKLTKIQRGEMM